ncbi:MAG: hypothetical protein ACOZNI_24285 [Myxococcota bacterium]
MRSLLLVALAAALLAPSAALAKDRHHHKHRHGHVVVAPPAVRIVVSPWHPDYRPDPRPGWVWMPGHWEGRDWVAGRWVPEHHRAGYVWVDGYWSGHHWVDGYWQPVGRVDERGHVEAEKRHHDYE